jgi:NADH:ubiquinone reductase (H+-translocating)
VTIETEKHLDHIEARTVIWAGGITASSLGEVIVQRTNVETDKGRRIKVKPDLTIPNYADIYVIGDLACAIDANGQPLPGLAQVAMQGGSYAGKAILQKVKGQPELPPFRYFDKGSLAVIGRAAAVANIFGLQLSGILAWLVWVVIHLMYIVSFQNRLLVFVQWAIEDLTFSRGARLITGSASTDFSFNKEVAKYRRAPEIEAETVAASR